MYFSVNSLQCLGCADPQSIEISDRALGDVLCCFMSAAFGTFEDRNTVLFKAENQNSDSSVSSHYHTSRIFLLHREQAKCFKLT